MSILRYEENGIEFFTVEATGESGISHRGLAILCGVAHWTINDLVKNLEAKKAAKRLKAFVGKELHLEGVYKKQGGEIKILRADFCAAVIKHYALEGRSTAEHSMDKFIFSSGWRLSLLAPSYTLRKPQRGRCAFSDERKARLQWVFFTFSAV